MHDSDHYQAIFFSDTGEWSKMFPTLRGHDYRMVRHADSSWTVFLCLDQMNVFAAYDDATQLAYRHGLNGLALRQVINAEFRKRERGMKYCDLPSCPPREAWQRLRDSTGGYFTPFIVFGGFRGATSNG